MGQPRERRREGRRRMAIPTREREPRRHSQGELASAEAARRIGGRSSTRMPFDALVAQLCRSPATPVAARRKPADGGLPPEPGLYAWWMTHGELPGIPLQHVSGVDASLVFVGVTPSRPGSQQTLRGRVVGIDLRGNISDSPFRRSLSALLWQREQWQLTHRGNRIMLAPDANHALTTWQSDHLCVSWAVHPHPWEVAQRVIKALSPPLNLAADRTHPYGWTLAKPDSGCGAPRCPRPSSMSDGYQRHRSLGEAAARLTQCQPL